MHMQRELQGERFRTQELEDQLQQVEVPIHAVIAMHCTHVCGMQAAALELRAVMEGRVASAEAEAKTTADQVCV